MALNQHGVNLPAWAENVLRERRYDPENVLAAAMLFEPHKPVTIQVTYQPPAVTATMEAQP